MLQPDEVLQGQLRPRQRVIEADQTDQVMREQPLLIDVGGCEVGKIAKHRIDPAFMQVLHKLIRCQTDSSNAGIRCRAAQALE
ncbi:hypothetical protein D3C81_1391870 [compost metagenome]